MVELHVWPLLLCDDALPCNVDYSSYARAFKALQRACEHVRSDVCTSPWRDPEALVGATRINVYCQEDAHHLGHGAPKDAHHLVVRAYRKMPIVTVRAYRKMPIVTVRAYRKMPIVTVRAYRKMPIVTVRAYRRKEAQRLLLTACSTSYRSRSHRPRRCQSSCRSRSCEGSTCSSSGTGRLCWSARRHW